MNKNTLKESTVSEPKIADTKPVVLQLEPGTYFWCACGQSLNQPWCDGSHAGTGTTPVKHEVEASTTAAMCMCKRTANKPLCDGSHSLL